MKKIVILAFLFCPLACLAATEGVFNKWYVGKKGIDICFTQKVNVDNKASIPDFRVWENPDRDYSGDGPYLTYTLKADGKDIQTQQFNFGIATYNREQFIQYAVERGISRIRKVSLCVAQFSNFDKSYQFKVTAINRIEPRPAISSK